MTQIYLQLAGVQLKHTVDKDFQAKSLLWNQEAGLKQKSKFLKCSHFRTKFNVCGHRFILETSRLNALEC